MYGIRDVATVSFLRRLAAVALVSLAIPVYGQVDAPPSVQSVGDSLREFIVLGDQGVNLDLLKGGAQLLEDRAGTLDIEGISRAPANTGFVAATPESANVGFSSSAWWVRFTVRNAADAPRLIYLRQNYPLIDSLDFFEPTGGQWRRHATGDRRPFGTRDVAHRDFLFPIDLPERSERTFYVRYQSQGPVDINLSLLGPNQIAEEISRENLAYGGYFGCVFMLLVWSGLVYVAVRDHAFLAYFAYVAVFGLYMGVNTGFAFQYLWPDSPNWANSCLLALLNTALITALQFSLTILRAHDYAPRLATVARVLQILAALQIALMPLMAYSVLVRPVALLILVAVVFMLALGGICMVAGSRPARFYVLAWGAFLAGSIVFLLKNFGVVPHTFMTQHSWQMGALVEMILLSMTLSSRMNELKHQSRTDPLTLLGNRRLFDDILPVEFAQAREQKRPLSLMVLDIDHFKAYNDKHGHAQGDEAIKLVGAALRRHARKPLVAFRYGGEEFCVILPGTNAEAAAQVAERLRASVQAVVPGDLELTVSVGYACLTADEFPGPDKLFEAADGAMYAAKAAGRNRVAEFHGRRTDDPAASMAGRPG